MRRVSAFAVAFGVLVAALSLSVAPAAASCIAPVPVDQAIAEASNVFVGVVIELRFNDRYAVFEVEDVWKGDLPDRVEVNGGPSLASLESLPEGVSGGSSVDRTYRLGGRYLVVPWGFDQHALADNACSVTQEFTDSLLEFRPADAHAPRVPEVPEADGPQVVEKLDEIAPPVESEVAEEPDEIAPSVDADKTDDGSIVAWLLAALVGAGGVGVMVLRRRWAIRADRRNP